MADSPLLKVLVAGGVIYAAAQLYHKYSQQHLGVEFRNMQIKILNIKPEDGDITINLKALNPNSENFEVQSFVGSMLVNGKKVADINMFGDYVVKGNAEENIALTAKPIVKNIYQQLAALMRSGKARVSLQGTMNVNKAAIPLTLTYNVA